MNFKITFEIIDGNFSRAWKATIGNGGQTTDDNDRQLLNFAII